MSTQQPEALAQECADYATSLRSAANVATLKGRAPPVSFLRAADLFERAASRITELESRLAQRFDAADMATAAAQGFRDVVASLAASVGSELVYQARYQKGFWQDSSRERYEYLQNPENTCADDWETRILYTHPSPPEGMAGWTTLPGQMPEPNTPVLLDIGKKFTIRALWAEKHTVRVGTDVDDWGEYDEETDEYYCPEGWYEWNEHEEVHWAVSETPRAWRELPPPLPAAPGPADQF